MIEEILFKHPNLINGKDCLGNTPIFWSSLYNNVKITELLKKHGAKLDIINNFRKTIAVFVKVMGHISDDPPNDAKKTKFEAVPLQTVLTPSPVTPVLKFTERPDGSESKPQPLLIPNPLSTNVRPLQDEKGMYGTNYASQAGWKEVFSIYELLKKRETQSMRAKKGLDNKSSKKDSKSTKKLDLGELDKIHKDILDLFHRTNHPNLQYVQLSLFGSSGFGKSYLINSFLVPDQSFSPTICGDSKDVGVTLVPVAFSWCSAREVAK